MITGVILARNEEQNIVDCIAALRPHVSEIILIDMDSSDRTVSLARPLVDKILPHPLIPNFDAARNVAIPAACNDWLWFVDADERIPQRTGEIVAELVRNRGAEFEAINVPFKSYFCGQWMQRCGWWPGYTCPRVLRRGSFEFSSTLHGGVKLKGREVRLPADPSLGVDHYSYQNIQHYIEKINRYTSTEALQLAQRGIAYHWRAALRSMVHDLWQYYELNRGDLDAERGWILSWLSAQYRWLSVTKLLDHGKSSQAIGNPESFPADLDEFVAAFQEELSLVRRRAPGLPFGVVWRGPIWASTPGAQASRDIVAELANTVRPITVDASRGPPAESPIEHNSLLRALQRCRRARHVVTFTQSDSGASAPDEYACYNVLAVLESDGISIDTAPTLSAYDEVWVNGIEEADTLRRWGIAPERIHVNSLTRRTPVAAALHIEEEVRRIESRFQREARHPPRAGQLDVVLEGEFFAGHSFSNINEQLAIRLSQDPSIKLSLRRVYHQPVDDRRAPTFGELNSLFEPAMERKPDVIIRHAFPPNWEKPNAQRWVHIQPWEFGYLPKHWLPALQNEVDEIWVMSKYVEQVYRKSGISPEKIWHIPWGIDTHVFRPDVLPLLLPTQKRFRFLFVGGAIPRKGFDRALKAYLTEFSSADDVCLVIKDMGTNSFYAPDTMRDAVFDAIHTPGAPSIVYMDNEMTPGQLASLYTACHCLLAPYRGEGFGLPVLEALACGVPPIVPAGGPTDDFVDSESGFILPSSTAYVEVSEDLVGPASELNVAQCDLQRMMQFAFQNPQRTHTMGQAGSQRIRRDFTWEETVRKMVNRLQVADHLQPSASERRVFGSPAISQSRNETKLIAVITSVSAPTALIDSLARICPFLSPVIVVNDGSDDINAKIATEYGAVVARFMDRTMVGHCDWALMLRAGEYVAERDIERLRSWLDSMTPDVDRIHFESTGERLVRPFATGGSPRVLEVSFGEEPIMIRSAISSTGVPLPSIQFGTGKPFCHSSASPADLDDEANACPRSSGDEDCKKRLRKSVLIQMATGQHLDLLDMTRDHHRRYADRHGMDYWCIAGNPVRNKRPGWGKIPLLLAAMEMGYETVIWLDADAIIVRPELDISKLAPDGIGMVRHPNPDHWNTGVVVARTSPDVQRFWKAANAAPENDSAWMEQYAVNTLASHADFAGLLCQLDLGCNSVPGFAMSESPLILAGHGWPMNDRKTLIEQCLRQLENGCDPHDATMGLNLPSDLPHL